MKIVGEFQGGNGTARPACVGRRFLFLVTACFCGSLQSSAREKTDDRHEYGWSDNGPDYREALAAHINRKQLGQSKLVRNPRPEKCSDKPEGDGYKTPAVAITGDSLPYWAANTGYQ